MRGRIGRWAVLLAVFAAAPAEARSYRASYELSGSLVVTWHGAPDRCAAAGVCGVSGTLTLAPKLPGELTWGTRSQPSASTQPFTRATVRVQRQDSPDTCLDVTGATDPFSWGGEPARTGIRLTPTGINDPATLSSGQCAGPRTADLAPALPTHELSLASIGSRPQTIPLAGRRTFTAGAFDGEVVSDVEWRIGARRATRGDEDEGGRSRPRPIDTRPPRATRVRFEVLEVRYRLASNTGSLLTSFSGAPAPACHLVDSCGLHGTTTLGLERLHGALIVISGRRLRPGRRARTLEEALVVARQGGRRVEVIGLLGDEARAVATTDVARDGQPPCRDRAEAPAPTLEADRRENQFRLTLGRRGQGVDALRSRCPGPRPASVPARAWALARGVAPLAVVGEPSFAIDLAASGGFAGRGYTGARSAAITLHFEREYARLRVLTEQDVP